MMSAQVFRTGPSSEMPRERWSGLPYEAQKNKFHPLQAHHNSLPLRRAHWHAPHALTTHWANPKSHRGSDKRPSTALLHTPEHQVPDHKCPQCWKRNNHAFPVFLSFPPALQLAMSNSYRKNNVCLLLFDRHFLNSYYVPGSMRNSGNSYKVTLTELLMYTRQALL